MAALHHNNNKKKYIYIYKKNHKKYEHGEKDGYSQSYLIKKG